MDLIGILVTVLICCVVWYAVNAMMAAFGIGDPIVTVVRIVMVVLFLIALVNFLGYGGGLIPLRTHRGP
jgi:uncharacterized membrane protein YwzB